MSLNDLTSNAVPRMADGTLDCNREHPVLQAIGVKPLQAETQGGQRRIRLVLSDGHNYSLAMLAINMSGLAQDGTVVKNGLVRITEYAVNPVSGRNLVVVLGLEKYADALPERLGSPQALPKAPPAPPAQQAQQAQQAEQAAPLSHNGVSLPSSKSEILVKPDPISRPTSFNTANYSAAGSCTNKVIDPPKGGTKSNFPYYPIEGLSPYQNKWMIRARVTAKGDIKHYTNARGEGKLFWVNLLDETGEIRSTAFNESVDLFYNLLQEGKVYYIARARVGIAKKQFSKLDNDYELTFNPDTEIVEAEDASSVPGVTFNFVPLDRLSEVEPSQFVDVIGVVQDVSDQTEIVAKATQKRVPKRELTLVDQSRMSVRLTLWGPTAINFRTDEPNPVIAFKGVRVGDFGGRSLSMIMSSTMHVNADVEAYYLLKGWYEGEGSRTTFKAYQGTGGGAGADPNNPHDRKTVEQVIDEGLGTDPEGKVDSFTILATLQYVKNTNLWYPACKSDGCNKKVTMEANGEWYCAKCDRNWPKPDYRFLFTGGILDHTGHLWVNGFNEVAEAILGVTAMELHEQYGDDSEDVKDFVMSKTGGVYTFSIKAKLDTFNDQERIRYNISRVKPVDWVRECEFLSADIDKMMAM